MPSTAGTNDVTAAIVLPQNGVQSVARGATAAGYRRRGLPDRSGAARDAGTPCTALHATAESDPAYLAMGYRAVEELVLYVPV